MLLVYVVAGIKEIRKRVQQTFEGLSFFVHSLLVFYLFFNTESSYWLIALCWPHFYNSCLLFYFSSSNQNANFCFLHLQAVKLVSKFRKTVL